jgi:Transcriptional regulator, AbiEi antitoxin
MARNSNHARRAATVASLAARQDGVVSRRQLEAQGVSRGQIEGWVRDGRLFPVFHTVYAIGHASIGVRGRLRAAALACPGAVISHRSAAFLLGFGEVAPRVVELIPTQQAGRKIDRIKAHRVPYPAPSERGHVRGIPCTSPARTIVDLAGTYGDADLRETVERAATARRLDLGAIDAILNSGPRRRGAPCLRGILDGWRPVAETAKYATVRSLFEAKLLPLLAAAGLPLPRINAPVHAAERILEVDLLWDQERFVVEADSRRHHAIEIAFERDRKRDRELLAVRYGVLRVHLARSRTRSRRRLRRGARRVGTAEARHRLIHRQMTARAKGAVHLSHPTCK